MKDALVGTFGLIFVVFPILIFSLIAATWPFWLAMAAIVYIFK